MVKLISNSCRYIQFASANQFFMICSQNNINFNKIRKIMTDSYSRGKVYRLPDLLQDRVY